MEPLVNHKCLSLQCMRVVRAGDGGAPQCVLASAGTTTQLLAMAAAAAADWVTHSLHRHEIKVALKVVGKH